LSTQLSEIDTNIGGPGLQQQDAAAFERAWKDFQLQFDPNASKSKQKIAEIAKLLDITGDNLDQVKGQKWFQRAWSTVSGENKRLARKNSENLLRVQKGAFYFLEGLAAQNQMMMQAVFVALQRVEDNQIQNERLKAHLLQVVRRYNDRLGRVESRQDHLEQRLDAHEATVERPVRRRMPALAVVIGVLALCGAVVAWLLAPEAFEVPGIGLIGRQAITASLAVLGTALSIAGIAGLRRAISRSEVTRKAPAVENVFPMEIDRVRRENARVRPRLARDLLERLAIRYSIYASSELADPIVKLFESLDACFDDDTVEPSSERFVQQVKKSLEISPDIRTAVRSQAQSAAGLICQDFNQLIGSVVEVNLKGDLGVKLATEAERSRVTVLARDLSTTFDVYDESIANIESTRLSLLGRYGRWKDVATESRLYSNAKAFLKGFFIVPFILDDEPEFMTDFGSDLSMLGEKWDGFRESLRVSLDNGVDAAVRPFVSELAARIDLLFDACDEEGVELTEVEATVSTHLSNELE